MPCQYYGPGEYEEILAREVNNLTRWLCAALKNLEVSAAPGASALPNEPGLREWWNDHQRRDREREAQERIDTERARVREAALAKLSPEERDALKA